ncbi:MAG: hypothetical protein KDI82_07640 [Gammaproteobacteria bacterium]|nr:hypothetical protein [Gammaproteobacteria bacterium]
MPRTRIKTAPWVSALLTFFVAFSAFGVALLSEVEDRNWVFWGMVLLLVLFVIALLAAALTAIINDGDAIRLVSNFRSTRIPKATIDSVAWQAGTGSFLMLKDGTRVRLPVTGRNEQGVVNSVRSWLS